MFSRLGFSVAEGPEIEDDWHIFTSLNFPEEHPAIDMQDTFFIRHDPADPSADIALRTHTSSVQVRLMEQGKPPFRAIMPGRVYRNEAISARAHCFFHPVEGRSEASTPAIQSLTRISYAVFSLQNKKRNSRKNGTKKQII